MTDLGSIVFVISHFLCTFATDNEPLQQAGGLASGVL